MLFNSLVFPAFLLVVLTGFYCLRARQQTLWLLIASYVFYGWWDWRFLSLIAISTVVDYLVGRALGTTEGPRRRRALLLTSLTSNLGILGFFKYCNFFIDSFAAMLASAGMHPNLPMLEVVLPVGISFYTFQTLSYTIDVYRNKIRPTRDPITFALFVAYFPQLVAGPIERAANLLPRLTNRQPVTWPGLAIGVELILIGYFKKVGIADTLGPMVDARFANPELASGSDLLLSCYLFAFQIYCDFSGYSDIARGVSRLFGVELVRNFNQPYFSTSITEFWRRWHLSLSTWLRDYLYISLGGNRHGSVRTYRNLILTMLLGGLWHGAAWTFVVWGGLHGLYLALHKALLSRAGRREPPPSSPASVLGAVKVLATFHLVLFAWVFFRSDGFEVAWAILSGIAHWQPPTPAIAELSWGSPRIIALLGLLFLVDAMQWRRGEHAFMVSWPWPARGLGYTALLLATLVLGNLSGNVPFIYFQF